ncbi:hypothetical protein N431DRAFT_472943 [Stipitochalara longipes BDJ]|nr:hypothetical protein N431DRAFT_472943 [Stipitochalara longipes BDJ]
MARTRQPLVNSNAHRFRCNEPGCTTTFGRSSEQQRHTREVHGPRTFCYMRRCKWSSKRRQRLKSHLSTIHPAEAPQTYHLVIPTAFSPTPETETASPSPPPESHLLEADPDPENGNDDNINALFEYPGLLSQQLSYTRAAHFPTSAQRRIRRDTRLRKHPASSWPSSRFSRKRSALSLPEHGLMGADPIDRDADGDADADADWDVDVEVQGMTTNFGGFGGDLGVSFDTEMEMDVGMERADLGLGAHFEMERGWNSMR